MPPNTGDPADRLFVDIIANMEPFLDSLEEGMKKGIPLAEEGGKKTSDTFADAFAEPIKKMLEEIEEAQKRAFGQVDIQALGGIEGRLRNIINLGEQQGRSTEEIFGNMRQVVDKYASGLEQGTGLTDLLGIASSKLGINIGGLAAKFGTLIGITGVVFGGLKELFDLIQESTGIALRFEQSQIRLVRQVNKFRVASGDAALTMGVVNEEIKELNERFGLGELAAEQLINTALRMTKEFNLTGEQSLALGEAAIALADSADEANSALFRISTFIRTGYNRALISLGISITDADIAQEAQRLGIEKTIDELSDAEKKQIRYNLVMEKSAELMSDAEKAAQAFGARIETANSDVVEAKARFGAFFLPLKTWIAEAGSALKVHLIDGLIGLLKGSFLVFAAIEAGFNSIGERITAAGKAAKEGDFAGFFKEFTPASESFRKEFDAIMVDVTKKLDLLETGLQDFGEANVESLSDAEKAWVDFESGFIAVSGDIKKELDGLTSEVTEKTAQIEQSFQDALDDIEKEFGQRRIDTAIELDRDLEDIDQDSAEDRITAMQNYLLDEFRITEDAKIKLLELENQYLFELEDAVRERDARQVLLLQRRHRQEVSSLETDTELRLKRLREDLQLELQEIERQRLLRRAERIEAYNEELADIKIQEDRKREDAKANRERELRDLEAHRAARLNELLKQFINEQTVTEHGLKNIYDLFLAYMGPGGAIEQVYAYGATLPQKYQVAPGGGATGAGTPTPAPGAFGGSYSLSTTAHGQVYNTTSPVPGQRTRSRQRGGTLFATSPTLIQAGEIPERVDITPLSQSTGQPRAGAGADTGNRHSSVDVAIMLSEGLEGEIVDQAMGEMADVFVKLNQGQRRATR